MFIYMMNRMVFGANGSKSSLEMFLFLLLLAALPRKTKEEPDKRADVMQPVQEIDGNVMCGKKKISRWPNKTITECYKCPKCPRGQGSNVLCGSVLKSPAELQIKIRCEKCDKGKKYSPNKSPKVCLECTKCKPNHKVLKNCKRRSNTVCGGCMDDSYEETTPFGMKTCEKCGRCCKDGKDTRIEECAKKGLPTNQVCSRNDAERCKQKRTPIPAAKTTATSIINLSTAKRRSSRAITTTPNSHSQHISSDQAIPTSPITQHSTEQPHAIHIKNNNSINTNSAQNGLLVILLSSILPVVILGIISCFVFGIIKMYRKHTDTTGESPSSDIPPVPVEQNNETIPINQDVTTAFRFDSFDYHIQSELAAANDSVSPSNKLQFELQPQIDRIDQNGAIPTNIETATTDDTAAANGHSDSPSEQLHVELQPQIDRIDWNGAIPTNIETATTDDTAAANGHSDSPSEQLHVELQPQIDRIDWNGAIPTNIETATTDDTAAANGHSDSPSDQLHVELQPQIDKIDQNGAIPTNIETATTDDTAAANGHSDSPSDQLHVELQPQIDRIDWNGAIPTNIETATTDDTAAANDRSDSPSDQLHVELQPQIDRIDHNGAVSTTKKQPETSDLRTCSCQLDAANGSDIDSSTNSESEEDKRSDDGVQSQIEQKKREEQSATVSEWANNRATHIGNSYVTMCQKMNVMKKYCFKSILCTLGLTLLEAAQYYPDKNIGDFDAALALIFTRNPRLKMEELAKILKKKKYNDLANLVREEDQRMANESANHGKMKRPALIRGESFSETVAAEEDHNVDQCHTTANPGLG